MFFFCLNIYFRSRRHGLFQYIQDHNYTFLFWPRWFKRLIQICSRIIWRFFWFWQFWCLEWMGQLAMLVVVTGLRLFNSVCPGRMCCVYRSLSPLIVKVLVWANEKQDTEPTKKANRVWRWRLIKRSKQFNRKCNHYLLDLRRLDAPLQPQVVF